MIPLIYEENVEKENVEKENVEKENVEKENVEKENVDKPLRKGSKAEYLNTVLLENPTLTTKEIVSLLHSKGVTVTPQYVNLMKAKMR